MRDTYDELFYRELNVHVENEYVLSNRQEVNTNSLVIDKNQNMNLLTTVLLLSMARMNESRTGPLVLINIQRVDRLIVHKLE